MNRPKCDGPILCSIIHIDCAFDYLSAIQSICISYLIRSSPLILIGNIVNKVYLFIEMERFIFLLHQFCV